MSIVAPHPARQACAFTLVELLAASVIIAILVGIMVPVFQAARAGSRDARCLANLRQIGAAIASYVSDSNGCLPVNPYGEEGYPAGGRWYNLLAPYVGKESTDSHGEGSVFLCPSNHSTDKDDAYALMTDYGYLCNLQLMPRLGANRTAPGPIRASSVSKRRILVCDTIRKTKDADKVLYIFYANAALEKVNPPLPDIDPARWHIHREGVHALWTDYSVSWMAEADLRRPGSQIPGGQYFGRGN